MLTSEANAAHKAFAKFWANEAKRYHRLPWWLKEICLLCFLRGFRAGVVARGKKKFR
jgi:hypothetical protein